MRRKHKKNWLYIHILGALIIAITGFLIIDKLNEKLVSDNYKTIVKKVYMLDDGNKGLQITEAIEKVKNSTEHLELKKKDRQNLLSKIHRLELENKKVIVSNKLLTKAKNSLDKQAILKAENEIDTLQDQDRRPLLKELDEVIKISNQKLIALTFDDGPNPATTPHLLDILKENNVKATFFTLGQKAQLSPDIVKREAKEGHEVGSHTWDHEDLLTCSPKEQKEEIERASNLVGQISGQKQTLFRPPYGNFNKEILSLTNLSAINWSVDTNDWRYTSSDPVVQNTLMYAHDGAIILLHDIHSWSVDAVPEIINELKKENYKFVTVSELLKKEGGIKKQQVYYGE
ncbi:polysaccharide deacetylase family protein [Lactococcus garvieae]|uniref:polysaccharide deacetylase family protein n=1 Tax=Lactococcus garvieae TaxID=1363 RepID=UPI001F60D095|nr:polysaccharide deacetylase family protein [Lactococcus garvieae]MCI3861380.1 polysaccharide deacetylase family protein [Lactococcus garvieae]